jgi:adenylate cyclase class IV
MSDMENIVKNTVEAQTEHIKNLEDNQPKGEIINMIRTKSKTVDEMVNAKVSIAYTNESEVKVFNLDTDAVISYLDANFEKSKPNTQMTCVYRIQMWKSKHAKVKLIIYNDIVYMQTKRSLDNDGINAKVKIEETVKVKDIEQTIRDLKFFGFKLIFDGIKDRTTWTVNENVVVTYDKWIGGQLAGVDYFEIENSHESIEIDYSEFVTKLVASIGSTQPYHISTKGTWAIYKLYTLTYLKSWTENDEVSFSEWIAHNPPLSKNKDNLTVKVDVKSVNPTTDVDIKSTDIANYSDIPPVSSMTETSGDEIIAAYYTPHHESPLSRLFGIIKRLCSNDHRS